MIEKNEVLNIASRLNLGHSTVEKDYVLGWLLDGIHNHPTTKSWVFKGGTSLKKCFFETFRFSEDLDFTINQKEMLNADELKNIFIEIADFLQEKVGIVFAPGNFKFKIIPKENGNFSAQGVLHYTGPLQMKQKTASIKLDLTTDEVLVLKPVTRKVHHPYSDEPEEGIHVICYAFEEVVAEKIRALGQRIRPRDLYDVIHFFRNRKLIQNPKLVCSVLVKKCQFKNISVPTYDSIENHEKLAELEPQWEHMLAHQLPSLPPMSVFWADLQPFFYWLNDTLETQNLIPSNQIAGTIFQASDYFFDVQTNSLLYKIQFAAANRVCIKLRYHNEERTIEPLSFRTIRDDKKLFFGLEREAGHVKRYEINKIESVEVTNLSYVEKYPVEISATGAIAMPPIERATSKKRAANFHHRNPSAYKIQCPICYKIFSRKKQNDLKLNKHKNGYEVNCLGRIGRKY